MKGLHIVREAWRDTWRQIIPTLLLFVVSIGATLGALLTAGQQVAQQQILHNQLKDPAARFVMIRDPSGELLNRQILTLLQNTSGVESAIGVGEVLEVESLGAKITAWAVTDSAVAIETTRGRALTAGEGVIDESLLSKIGWDVPSGAVYAAAQREIAVVAGERLGLALASLPTPCSSTSPSSKTCEQLPSWLSAWWTCRPSKQPYTPTPTPLQAN
ncbi:hypothetical protein [Trueperella pyogenes]|uniref:hypothetical protein n=1 Tax=Trueperella pyogenes TaxID=1661 RepID=UPI00345CE83F